MEKDQSLLLREKVHRHQSNLHGTVGTLGLTGFWHGRYFREGAAQLPKEKRIEPFPSRGSIIFNDRIRG